MRSKWWNLLVLTGLMAACQQQVNKEQSPVSLPDSVVQDNAINKDTSNLQVSTTIINTGNITPEQVVAFGKTLIGTKYHYGSTDPAIGFDCSGFITYVFNHFNIKVPRSSIDFTNVGRTVPLDSAKAGDLILFTGTDSTERFIGHMGIIVSNQNDSVAFIHSTSGKQYGVTITPLSRYYLGRYIRTARIFPQNER